DFQELQQICGAHDLSWSPDETPKCSRNNLDSFSAVSAVEVFTKLELFGAVQNINNSL
ncbi:hypothetical protein L9F63_005198, partial [Diploptera punctata]